MGTFNAYGQKSASIGGHTPIWLGKVRPTEIGGTLAEAWRKAGLLIPAGTPVNLANDVITPLALFEVVSYSAGGSGDTVDTVVIKAAAGYNLPIIPKVADMLQKLGANFAAQNKAAAVASIAAGATEGQYTLTVLKSANLGSLNAGDFLVYSAATAAGSSKDMAAQPNGYLYNDIYMDADVAGQVQSYVNATGAVVKHLGDDGSILVNRNEIANVVKDMMAVAVPNVNQVIR